MFKQIVTLLGTLCLSTAGTAIPVPPLTGAQLFNNGWELKRNPDEHWTKTINDNGRLMDLRIFPKVTAVLIFAGFTCGLNTTAITVFAWRPYENFGTRMACDGTILYGIPIPDEWNKGAGLLPLEVRERLQSEINEE